MSPFPTDTCERCGGPVLALGEGLCARCAAEPIPASPEADSAVAALAEVAREIMHGFQMQTELALSFAPPEAAAMVRASLDALLRRADDMEATAEERRGS